MAFDLEQFRAIVAIAATTNETAQEFIFWYFVYKFADLAASLVCIMLIGFGLYKAFKHVTKNT